MCQTDCRKAIGSQISGGQHVRISKENLKPAKGSKQNYTTEIFNLLKVVHKSPRPLYELADLLLRQIDGQFYAEDLSPVQITKRTTYVGHLESKERLRIQTAQLFNFS